MVKGMSIASFTYDSFHSIDTYLFSSLNESHKLKNLTKKVEKVWHFFLSRSSTWSIYLLFQNFNLLTPGVH